MIYTIGYQALAPERLSAIVTHLGAVLVDVRSSRSTRKAGFGSRQLAERFGDRYLWFPDLGGRAVIDDDAIGSLFSTSAYGDRPPVLMCMEEAPAECHRHFEIARRLLLLQNPVDCVHIFRQEMILASELQASIDEDRLYWHEDLAV